MKPNVTNLFTRNSLFLWFNRNHSCKLMNVNKATRRPNRRGQKATKNRKRTNKNTNVALSTIMPIKVFRLLRYCDSSYVRNNPGGNYLVYSFRVNDLYDPDPLILSGSVTGFKELMQFYQYYRVLDVQLQIKITNNETFSLMYGGVFSQTNLTGVITSRDDAINALESTYSSRSRILSAKGGMDRGSLTMKIPIHAILGDRKQYLADYNYIGVGLATPSIPLWFNMIVASPTGASLTNGYTNSTNITFRSEFFGLLNLRA